MGAFEVGRVVFSKRGRDRGAAYIVVGSFTEGGKEYAYLADGKRRAADRPKKKKSAHIQPTNVTVPVEEGLLSGEQGAANAYLRKALIKYNKGAEAIE